MKRWLMTGLVVMATGWLGIPGMLQAGTLDEMAAAVQSHSSSGAISDADVKATLDDLIAKARVAADAQADSAYRSAFIDVVNAYTGAGITSEAASNLTTLAQP